LNFEIVVNLVRAEVLVARGKILILP
jgi:hypothetical protein